MEDIVSMMEKSMQKNWSRDALTDYKGATMQYKDVARKIEKLHLLFETIGIEKGDKVAICGRNSSNWAVAFLATLTYGAVVVPILHEFKADNIHNIINHSEAKLAFIGDAIWENLVFDYMPGVLGVVQLNDYSILETRTDKLTFAREHLNELFGHKYPNRFEPKDISYFRPDPEALAMINYTSGSTGFSKGVMIPYRAIYSNIMFAREYAELPLKAGCQVVSMLPSAHGV